MAMAAVHPRILGFLGRALSLELTAVQQYMTQASLVELWGDAEAAAHSRSRSAALLILSDSNTIAAKSAPTDSQEW